jgi:transcriptional regulator with XRE-family HTH domain
MPEETHTSPTVVPLHARMSPAEYQAERERLRLTYGENANHANARREQALAALFHRSQWTQEDLARVEGKSRNHISQLLTFGRFLGFVATATNAELPPDLTERRFRHCWQRTDGTNERGRFLQVRLLLQESTPRTPARHSLRKDILEHYTDGKYRSATQMAEELKVTEDHVKTCLDTLGRQSKDVKVESKRVGVGHHYRLFPMDKVVSLPELNEKQRPLFAALEEIGKAQWGRSSPVAVASIARKLIDMLDEFNK